MYMILFYHYKDQKNIKKQKLNYMTKHILCGYSKNISFKLQKFS